MKLLLSLTVSIALLGLAPPASGVRAMPGSFTGYAFDQCLTPSQSAMDAWLRSSPYWGVGVYVAGKNRFCEQQPNLTREWVSTQSRKGWRILPITVGRQASCFSSGRQVSKISADPSGDYATARTQGRRQATNTLRASERLGFPRRTTHWLDIEAFDVTRTHCRRSMLAFVSGWTAKLHDRGYRSGYYSSAASGITALEGARTRAPGAYRLPDQIWIAHWNGRANANTSYLPAEAWRGQRVHQYLGGHDERYGGVRINVDSNWMEIGGGSRAPKAAPHCGVPIDFPTYGNLRRGSRGPKVAALECLLRRQRVFHAKVDQHFDKLTSLAVKRYQRQHPRLATTGRVNKQLWVALLADGRTPLLKVGAASDVVRRLQRALNAATPERLDVTGIYDKPTAKAVKRYQRAVGLPRTGVATDQVWEPLKAGRR